MNFFERQHQARGASRRLVLLFALAVAVIVLAVDAALVVLFGLRASEPGGPVDWALTVRSNAGPLAIAALGTVATIGIASLVRIGMLRAGGGAAVARSMGGTAVSEDTTDPQLRRLRNVVEEIAIAASVPVPEIYVLDREEGINAFAAGYSPSDAAIAVTRGALTRLNRDELQGVIAHEFSHVLNGDMRLNIRLIGVLFGILVLGIIGRRVLIHTRGGRDSRAVGGILLVGLVLFILGYVGVFCGRLIKAGISRERERLADASAVQFTRQTSGLAGALKKIAGLPEGSRLASAETEEVSHMLFGEGLGFSSLFATHPPIVERIRALDPSFDARGLQALQAQYAHAPPDGLAEDALLGLAPVGAMPLADGEVRVTPARVIDQVADPEPDDFRRAGVLRAALPEPLQRSARTGEGAAPTLLGLLLSDDAQVRARQLLAIRRRLGDGVATAAEGAFAAAGGLHPMLRLPLASLAFAPLRRRPRADLEHLVAALHDCVEADGRVGLFEYCLAKLVDRQVLEALDPSSAGHGRWLKLAQCERELVDLFSVLASHGHADDAGARRAFAAGLHAVLPHAAESYRPPRDWIAALDHALPQLDRVEPRGKALLVEGLTQVIQHDGRMTVAEAELLRTICACLHCPLPPMLERAGG